MQMTSKSYILKILIVGSCGVGKTSIVNRLVYNTFTNEYKATLGVDFSFKNMDITTPEGTKINVKVQLWDIAGQEKTSVLTRSYYKDATACLLVGDLTREGLVQDVASWLQDVRQKAFVPGSQKPIPCVLLCNKADAVNPQKFNQVKEDAHILQLTEIWSTSALTGENLEQALVNTALAACKNFDQDKKQTKGIQGINLAEERKGCC